MNTRVNVIPELLSILYEIELFKAARMDPLVTPGIVEPSISTVQYLKQWIYIIKKKRSVLLVATVLYEEESIYVAIISMAEGWMVIEAFIRTEMMVDNIILFWAKIFNFK